MALHRHLDGEGPQPLSLYVARMCQAFNCTPTQLEREHRMLPDGFLDEVHEAMTYDSGHARYTAQPKGPHTGVVAEVERIAFAIAQAEIEAKKTP
jgi:hypothetical protein